MAAEPKSVLTAEEVAEACRTSVWTVRRWRRAGIGPTGRKFPGSRRLLYDATEVDSWLSSVLASKGIGS